MSCEVVVLFRNLHLNVCQPVARQLLCGGGNSDLINGVGGSTAVEVEPMTLWSKMGSPHNYRSYTKCVKFTRCVHIPAEIWIGH